MGAGGLAKPEPALVDEDYRREVRKLSCCACRLGMPGGGGDPRAVDPHHGGRRPGGSLKCSDHDCIPLCRRHHQAIERDHAPFKGWPRERRFAWIDDRIAETRQAVARARRLALEPPIPW